MLDAREAFDKSKRKLEETTQTIDELLKLDKKIKEAIEGGYFGVYSEPMPVNVAEVLTIELEEYGYAASCLYANMMDADKKPLAYINICWRYKPRPDSRVKQPESI